MSVSFLYILNLLLSRTHTILPPFYSFARLFFGCFKRLILEEMQLFWIQMWSQTLPLTDLVWVGLAPPVCGYSILPVRERLVDCASPVYQAVRNPDQDRQSCSSNMQSRSFQVLAHMTGTTTGEVPLCDLMLQCLLAPPVWCLFLFLFQDSRRWRRRCWGGAGRMDRSSQRHRCLRLLTEHTLCEFFVTAPN